MERKSGGGKPGVICSAQQTDQKLLNAMERYLGAISNPMLNDFRPHFTDWGSQWQRISPVELPASDILFDCAANTMTDHESLLSLFCQYRRHLHWEQSYTKSDNVVGDDMLQGYGFAEITGLRGPFVSDRIRSGIGVWGAQIDYPNHQHQAEEIYIVLAGSAVFRLGDQEPKRCEVGDLIHVESNTSHGFHTEQQALVVIYLWQNGDLRQTSNFS